MNFLDYMQWRGDLTLAHSPLNEVDNLILSYLSYVNLDGIAPGPKEGSMTVREAGERFFAKYTEDDLKADKSFIRLSPYVMKAMAQTERFAEMRIQNYVNHIDEERALQFAALEIVLGDGTSYVSFRGTDDTIVGWQEDFNLCNGVVPAQKEAVEYLNRVGSQTTRGLHVGGHSKGGNLAIYAAVDCDEAVQKRIIDVYNFDGPGFTKEFMETPALHRICSKMHRVIPESSIIGMLLEHVAEPVIIKSSQKGVMQHDGFSWEVLGTEFVRCQKRSAMSEVFDDTLKNWLGGLDEKQRCEFIEDFFSVLGASGATTLTGLQDGGIKAAAAILKKTESLRPDSRKVIEALLKEFLSHWTDLFKTKKDE